MSGPLLLPSWDQLAAEVPGITEPMRRYLEQIACVLRPGSVVNTDQTLRCFAAFPAEAGTDRVFTVLKGPRRGMPLSADGLDEILDGARQRAGLAQATCHQLRHTCLTQLRKAGMSLEAVQAQAGHASIESTRIYLHLGDDWLASQFRKAAEAIDAQLLPGSIAGAQ